MITSTDPDAEIIILQTNLFNFKGRPRSLLFLAFIYTIAYILLSLVLYPLFQRSFTNIHKLFTLAIQEPCVIFRI